MSFEKRVLEDEHARIVNAVSSREEPDAVDLEFSTYLVRAGGRWRVDHDRTVRSVRMSAAIGDIFGEIDRLGRELSEQFGAASRQLSADSGEAVVASRERLEQVDPEVFGPYREAWQRQGAKIQADMARLLEELSR